MPRSKEFNENLIKALSYAACRFEFEEDLVRNSLFSTAEQKEKRKTGTKESSDYIEQCFSTLAILGCLLGILGVEVHTS